MLRHKVVDCRLHVVDGKLGHALSELLVHLLHLGIWSVSAHLVLEKVLEVIVVNPPNVLRTVVSLLLELVLIL